LRKTPLVFVGSSRFIMAAALLAVIGRPNNVGKPTVCRRTLGHSDDSDAFRGRARSLHGRHVFGWGGKVAAGGTRRFTRACRSDLLTHCIHVSIVFCAQAETRGAEACPDFAMGATVLTSVADVAVGLMLMTMLREGAADAIGDAAFRCTGGRGWHGGL
jgi:hypothetical protein